MLKYSTQALELVKADMGFIRLDKEAFAQCPSDSIDYAVMEKTQHGELPVVKECF